VHAKAAVLIEHMSKQIKKEAQVDVQSLNEMLKSCSNAAAV